MYLLPHYQHIFPVIPDLIRDPEEGYCFYAEPEQKLHPSLEKLLHFLCFSKENEAKERSLWICGPSGNLVSSFIDSLGCKLAVKLLDRQPKSVSR